MIFAKDKSLRCRVVTRRRDESDEGILNTIKPGWRGNYSGC